MQECSLVLPYPPSVNHYKNPGRLILTTTGRLYQPRVDTKETKVYYQEVGWICLQKGIASPMHGELHMEVDLYPPDKRKRDIDGPLKVLLDSLQRGRIYEDDSQIVKLLVNKLRPKDKGIVVVNIRTAE